MATTRLDVKPFLGKFLQHFFELLCDRIFLLSFVEFELQKVNTLFINLKKHDVEFEYWGSNNGTRLT